ncbi:MAG TPA: ATP-binding protein [Gemmatimonadaceae bacterium]
MVQVDVDASLPYVSGDRVQLQQVLVNLILNACDAMATTEPADRRLLIAGAMRDDGSCELTVADHGPGIALEMMECIFEPFVTSKQNGVGLGLAICRKVVTQHGGRLWVESTPSGATFHLELPSVVHLPEPVSNASRGLATLPYTPLRRAPSDTVREQTL